MKGYMLDWDEFKRPFTDITTRQLCISVWFLGRVQRLAARRYPSRLAFAAASVSRTSDWCKNSVHPPVCSVA